MTRTELQDLLVDLLEDDPNFMGFTIKKSVQAVYPHDYNVLSPIGALLVTVLGANHEGEINNTTLGKVTRIKIAVGVRSAIDDCTKLDDAIDAVYDCLSYQRISLEADKLMPVLDRTLTERPVDGIFWSEVIFKILHYVGR
jgi:hypothetical protein